MTERVVLAYSGGLDTSVAIGWIAEETGAEVVAVAVDVGQGGEDLEVDPQARARLRRGRGRRRRRPRRVRRAVLPAGAAGQRPLHGPLPAGLRAVPAADRQAPGRAAPRVRRHDRRARLHRQGQRPGPLRGRHRRARPGPARCIAPVRDFAWTREKAIAYAEEHDLPIDVTQAVAVLDRPERLGPRGRDRLPRGHLERPDRGRLLLHPGPGRSRASRRGRRQLRAGRARSRSTATASRCCRRSRSSTRRAGAHGVGRLDMVEDRLVGIKSREVYEAPGAIALITAHQELESVTVERDLGPVQAHRRPALGRAGLRRAVVLPAQGGAGRVHRDEPGARHRRDPDDAARRPGGRRPAAARTRRSTTSTSPPTTRATRSTSRWPRASCSCGACPARSRRAGAGSSLSRRRSRRRITGPPVRAVARSGAAGSPPARPTRWPRCRSRRTSTGGSRRTTSRARWRTPACCTAPGCSPTTSWPGCSPRWRSSTPTSPPARSRPRPDDEDVHTALERGLVERGGPGARRQAARRPLPQRPGRDAVPDVAARRRPPGRRGRLRRRRRPARPGDRHTRTRRCRVGRTCSTPSRCCSPTTCRARARAAARRRPAARLGPAHGGVALRLGCAGRVVARAGPGGGRRRARLRRRRRRTRSTARRRATSPPRPRSCSR